MLDVDGVLVAGKPASGTHWAATLRADLGLDFATLRERFFDRHWDAVVTGRAGLRERLAPVLADCAPDLPVERLVDYWFRNDARLNRDLLRDVARLRAGGMAVHLATNQEHARARFLLHDLGLAAYVDGCHHSAAIGQRKPKPAYFHQVAARVGHAPGELLLVDDTAANVRAAIQAGWQAALWTSSATLSAILAAAGGSAAPALTPS